MHVHTFCVQITDKAEKGGRTNHNNTYIYDTFKAGLAANTIYGFQQALDVVDRSWTTP